MTYILTARSTQQFVKEGHLRWDSLGEYLATAVALEHMGTVSVSASDKGSNLCHDFYLAVMSSARVQNIDILSKLSFLQYALLSLPAMRLVAYLDKHDDNF